MLVEKITTQRSFLPPFSITFRANKPRKKTVIVLFCCSAAGIDSQSLIYEKPYCRIATYLVGMVLGYLLLHGKDWRPQKKVTFITRIKCSF